MQQWLTSCALGVAVVAVGLSSPSPLRAQQPVSIGVRADVRQPGSIVGTAWRHDNTPIANALLRLRDVSAGRIVMGSQSDATGRFSFASVAPGSYVVELVDQNGGVRAVGQMFGVGPGDTVATFIRLGSRAGWFDGFFSNAAAAAISTAASLGVTAVGNGGQPASARF